MCSESTLHESMKGGIFFAVKGVTIKGLFHFTGDLGSALY